MRTLLILFMLFSPLVAAKSIEQLEQEVREVEKAFAKTMADRDFAGFKTFLDPNAVFFADTKIMRGSEEIATQWHSLFVNEIAPFSWHPEQVAVSGDGTVALSTGPVSHPDGRVFAYYQSTWRKNPQGEWKIVLDKGQKYCPPSN